jgi:GNAT superfamily N-acetyltransferase
VSVTELKASDVAYVDQFLPLSRLSERIDEESTYLVAWDDRQPVGHAHIAWTGTHLGVPEIQDVFVLPEWRRQGIASQLALAAEDEARARGWDCISLSASQEGNDAARRLYGEARVRRRTGQSRPGVGSNHDTRGTGRSRRHAGVPDEASLSGRELLDRQPSIVSSSENVAERHEPIMARDARLGERVVARSQPGVNRD